MVRATSVRRIPSEENQQSTESTTVWTPKLNDLVYHKVKDFSFLPARVTGVPSDKAKGKYTLRIRGTFIEAQVTGKSLSLCREYKGESENERKKAEGDAETTESSTGWTPKLNDLVYVKSYEDDEWAHRPARVTRIMEPNLNLPRGMREVVAYEVQFIGTNIRFNFDAESLAPWKESEDESSNEEEEEAEGAAEITITDVTNEENKNGTNSGNFLTIGLVLQAIFIGLPIYFFLLWHFLVLPNTSHPPRIN